MAKKKMCSAYLFTKRDKDLKLVLAWFHHAFVNLTEIFLPKCCHDYAILLFLLHFYEAILFYLQADVGQEEDFEAAKKKAAKLGAIKVSLNSINANRSYNTVSTWNTTSVCSYPLPLSKPLPKP